MSRRNNNNKGGGKGNNKGGGGGKGQKGKQREDDAAATTPGLEKQEADEGIGLKGDFVLVDGSYLEGGGQILRNTFALAGLLNKPMRIEKIRAGRDNPGLRPQHLKGIELVNELFKGTLTGGKVGSSNVSFIPKYWNPDTPKIVNVGTAGSLPMLVQASLPCLVFGPRQSTIKFIGGTNVAHSPPVDFVLHTLIPSLRQFGIEFNVNLEKRGFYPRGGGEMTLTVNPVTYLKPIQMLDPGTINKIHVLVYVSGRISESDIPNRISKAATKVLYKQFPAETVNYDIETQRDPHGTDGCGIQLSATTTTGCIFSGSCIGERGVTSETVGEKAAEKLITDFHGGGCVDEYLQDQLIIFMAIANGVSKVRIGPVSLHTKTAIYFTQQLTGCKFTMTPTGEFKTNLEDSYIIECEGIGYRNKFISEDSTTTTTTTSGSSSSKSSSSSSSKS